ncbi:hypothetical protein F0310_04415 (plasmid) [Borrelia sp. A-FGy1]|uniref:hypothetical protein n=1 Tax=Borrelia sp. A-FGy1 TaxID=2608247 RepID=UPI0015F3A541|nr:hypothetical protein [Borrelia sp. A-FGy1]QMU99670.1 hypothetical protein F0310_04415 [Borrelia sp. A-FGy1]
MTCKAKEKRISNDFNDFNYKERLKELIRDHFPPLEGAADTKEALLYSFFARMLEFANSNVLATSLHAYRMFFATLGMSDVEDLILDIINKEKLVLQSDYCTKSSTSSSSYTEEEIKELLSKGE